MIGLKSNVMITRYYKIAKIIIDKKEVLSTEDRWFLVPGDFFTYGCIPRKVSLRLYVSIMLWVGLLCVIVVFPDHTHLLFTQTHLFFFTYQL